ncbi:hypothetical protein TWF696_001475 [Orbilia brochopaga]|uniref:C2H2-type domain-containing protein n=1 Tax=Orbilia brochopaga TaxID=3140254 RepID=A0AAV9U9M7_9PEZI
MLPSVPQAVEETSSHITEILKQVCKHNPLSTMNRSRCHEVPPFGLSSFDNGVYQIYSLGNLDSSPQKSSTAAIRVLQPSPPQGFDSQQQSSAQDFQTTIQPLNREEPHSDHPVLEREYAISEMPVGGSLGDLNLSSHKSFFQPPFLQCLNIGCPSITRSVEQWRSHNNLCPHSNLPQETNATPAIQCPFISCSRLFATPFSLSNHYSQHHLVYVCGRPQCQLAFEQETLAEKHICVDNIDSKSSTRSHPRKFICLEPKGWSLKEIQKGKLLTRDSFVPYDYFSADDDAPPVESTEISPEANEGLVMSGSPSSISSTAHPRTPEIPNSLLVEPSLSPEAPGEPYVLPGARHPNAFTSPAAAGLSSSNVHKHALQHQQRGVLLPRPTKEPPVIATLTCAEQMKYLTVLMNICVKAAYNFYTLHKLRGAVDKKNIPIFLTKDKQIARLPFDLTLPQWTQHLRKACDTRFINADMVYCLESFKGEIQPVDEVRHALVKEKTKSDRAFLAVIEAVRTFVKQLKDWQRCEMVDAVYDEVEGLIFLKKRHTQVGGLGQEMAHPEPSSPKGARRNTWN